MGRVVDPRETPPEPSLPVRLLGLAHGLVAAVSLLLLVAFLPALGAPRVPVLYRLLYADARWILLEFDLYAVPALFVAVVFAFTGPMRWSLETTMRRSPWFARTLVWGGLFSVGAWLMVLAVVIGGIA